MVTPTHLAAECETLGFVDARLPLEDEYENDDEDEFLESLFRPVRK